MIGKVIAQWRRRALIKQNAHSRGFQGMHGMFENAPGLLARYAGKPGQKIGKLCPVFEILEQGGDRNARAAEHPCSAYPGWIPLNGGAGRPVDHDGNLPICATLHNARRQTNVHPDPAPGPVFLVDVFSRSDKANLTRAQRNALRSVGKRRHVAPREIHRDLVAVQNPESGRGGLVLLSQPTMPGGNRS